MSYADTDVAASLPEMMRRAQHPARHPRKQRQQQKHLLPQKTRH